jgi:hypothetical protein
VRVEPALILAAHDGKQMALLSKTVAAGKDRRKFETAMRESEKVFAAREKIKDFVSVALDCLLSAPLIPEMIASDDDLEIRLLLCRKEAVNA